MNLIDLYVTEILSEPYQTFHAELTPEQNAYWFIDVMADAERRISKHTIMKRTKEEIDAVSIGYVFQA